MLDGGRVLGAPGSSRLSCQPEPGLNAAAGQGGLSLRACAQELEAISSLPEVEWEE